MFLSRCQLNPQRRAARGLLGSPQSLHAAVLSSFPESMAGRNGSGRVLWRLDREAQRTLLYVLSPTQPDFTHLIEQAGWPQTHAWDSVAYNYLLSRLGAGQEWAFRLVANPVRSGRSAPDSTRTQRFGHVTVQQQLGWLLDRAGPAGFAICQTEQGDPDVLVSDRSVRSFSRNGSRVTLARARFDGRLRVTDPERLRVTLVGGLGRAKAYGCGLITLASVANAS